MVKQIKMQKLSSNKLPNLKLIICIIIANFFLFNNQRVNFLAKLGRLKNVTSTERKESNLFEFLGNIQMVTTLSEMEINWKWFRTESILMRIYVYHVTLSKLFFNLSDIKMSLAILCITGKLDFSYFSSYSFENSSCDVNL